MTPTPEFALVPISKLHAHEEFEEENVVELVAQIERTGIFADPIWVSKVSLVILNGHHRVEALRRLRALRVPAWMLDYETDIVSLEPWRAGLPITKAEVVRRALDGHLFPPKTTRHHVRVELPVHTTTLDELRRTSRGRTYPGRPGPSRRPDAGTPESG